jgi:hypothetical protein
MDPITNCARKDSYPDRKTARAALAGMKRAKTARGEKITGTLGVFRCKMGRHWHIGRRNGRRGR